MSTGECSPPALASPTKGKIITVPADRGEGTIRNGSQCLLSETGFTTGWQRVLLWANGTVQRILSSYHNQAVTIKVIRNEPVLGKPAVFMESYTEPAGALLFNREVQLKIGDRILCVAQSKIAVTDSRFKDLLITKGVGIGQVFHYAKIVPDFRLLKVGQLPDQSFWRLYSLSCEGVYFEIHEHFMADVLVLDHSPLAL
ncbi:hypothetical protein H4R33_000049 [Dimargaris cristalligena]|uniref:Uncharacterized protein n=1 Tax=Dimargaris cristalligena TaxID=215637 RepID=A0A4P9ZWT6_9FUNG|nr:hypothetical protein H4R33_000049 [Dimargaris cristalligena]RKP38136.1 hypothetical protein BJ085DRAFT_33456 [Dimargaris cristalligena]|eukprot:RKP38136.1 hypothetical protein BJ085DRAFT_33456 [Dimargaris cristalligena]